MSDEFAFVGNRTGIVTISRLGSHKTGLISSRSDNGCSVSLYLLSLLTVTVVGLHNPCPRWSDGQTTTLDVCVSHGIGIWKR